MGVIDGKRKSRAVEFFATAWERLGCRPNISVPEDLQEFYHAITSPESFDPCTNAVIPAQAGIFLFRGRSHFLDAELWA
jgi:hypothetical protein